MNLEESRYAKIAHIEGEEGRERGKVGRHSERASFSMTNLPTTTSSIPSSMPCSRNSSYPSRPSLSRSVSSLIHDAFTESL